MLRWCWVAALSMLAVSWGPGCSSRSDEDVACVRNSQCPIGYVCRDGLCVEGCTNHSDCLAGQICADGVCLAMADAGDDGGAEVGLDIGEEAEVLPTPLGIGPDGEPLFGATVGETCATGEDCRSGLVCDESDRCVPESSGDEGDPCTIAGECEVGLSCGTEARCVASRGLAEDEACNLADLAVCGPGLRCELAGLSGVCRPEGEADIGRACESHADCLSPLVCSPAGTCQIAILGGVSRYPGAVCADDAESDFRVYFEVPGGEPLSEFYRLPYPNDIRRTEVGVDMRGHPSPGLGELAGDLIGSIIDTVADSGRGFSTSPTVFFRLSGPFDFDSIEGGGEEPTLRLVGLDPDSPSYGRGTSMYWFMNTGRGKYICPNYIAVRPSWHTPLEHGTTYAVYLTEGIRSSTGEPPVRDPDFAVVAGSDEPSEPRLLSAWRAYQPFRDYLTHHGIEASSIAGAAVFTTMDPDLEFPAIRGAVRARLVEPALEAVTLCDQGAVSPCDDGAERICLAQEEGVFEVHATYRAPYYQSGRRPHLVPEDGGNLVFDEDGLPEAQGQEDICLSMTVPDAPMPANGWPVVLFAHGTGGNFLSHIRNGTAGRLSEIDLGGAEPVRLVSIGIDGVQHGTRRGGTNVDPELLFFNAGNADAWLGNVQQGAADYFFLTWLVELVDLSAAQSPTGRAIRFDPDQIYFFGHSQGAVVGTPFVAYEPDIRGAVFSGAGAGLVLSLLNKESPVSVSDAVRLLLDDGVPGDNHPVLSLVQQALDPVDPINTARLLFRSPPEEVGRTHLFVSYGLGDTYAPDPTIEVFGSQSGVQMALPTLRHVEAISSVSLPTSGNRGTVDDPVTAVMVTYEPPGDEDGHFVIFRDERAVRQSLEFLGTAVRDGVPTVSP